MDPPPLIDTNLSFPSRRSEPRGQFITVPAAGPALEFRAQLGSPPVPESAPASARRGHSAQLVLRANLPPRAASGRTGAQLSAERGRPAAS
ncbi:hypothetical protein FKM82_005008 [Ascaphus truei]